MAPAELKRLRNATTPVVAVDDSTQARLAALEQQLSQDHLYKLEIVQAVQALRSMVGAGQPYLEMIPTALSTWSYAARSSPCAIS